MPLSKVAVLVVEDMPRPVRRRWASWKPSAVRCSTPTTVTKP